jgi:pimeloyl-ACP methyl ester carboxylesterase
MRQLRRDGVALFYEEAGGGELPLVFVHGWCCDHTYFALSSSTSVVSTASWRSTYAGTAKATSPCFAGSPDPSGGSSSYPRDTGPCSPGPRTSPSCSSIFHRTRPAGRLP